MSDNFFVCDTNNRVLYVVETLKEAYELAKYYNAYILKKNSFQYSEGEQIQSYDCFFGHWITLKEAAIQLYNQGLY